MKIGIIGTGYVGLVAGAGFANLGNDVICVDSDPERIAMLGRGAVPFYEPGLPKLVSKNTVAGRLRFVSDVADAVAGADVVFIAVGTPSLPDGTADLSQVLTAAEQVGRALTRETVIVTKSTVPVGTAEKVCAAVGAAASVPFVVASNPEFLREGAAVKDFLAPDRVVVGIDAVPDEAARERALATMRWLYRFVSANAFLAMDCRSAELAKYAANAYLATRVSFINDIANLCDRVGADVAHVRHAMSLDHRIGHHFLSPGIGFGGSCFPKDTTALMATGKEHGLRLDVVESTALVNRRQKHVAIDKLKASLGSVFGRVIAVWGLAFKPETDDVREAPAISLIQCLLKMGASVRAYDPIALDTAAATLGTDIHLTLCTDPIEATKGADALVLCTEWSEFRRADVALIRTSMRGRLVVDGRNFLDPHELRAAGFEYAGIGRGSK